MAFCVGFHVDEVGCYSSHVCQIGGSDQDPIAPPMNPLDLSQRMDRVAFLAEFFPKIRPGNNARSFEVDRNSAFRSMRWHRCNGAANDPLKEADAPCMAGAECGQSGLGEFISRKIIWRSVSGWHREMSCITRPPHLKFRT